MNLHRRLIVHNRRKGQTVTQGNGGIALDDLGEQSAARFQAKTQRQDVKQNDVLYFAGQYSALNRCAHGYDFIRVNLRRWRLSKNLRDRTLNNWRPRLTADEDYLVDVTGRELCIVQRSLAGLDRLLD